MGRAGTTDGRRAAPPTGFGLPTRVVSGRFWPGIALPDELAYAGMQGRAARPMPATEHISEEDITPVRYAYGLTGALLIGGAALTLATGLPAGAQVAQNDASQLQAITPRVGAPSSFADLIAQLKPAVVNISTRQRVEVDNANPFAGTPFEGLFGGGGGGGGGQGAGPGAAPQTREGQSLGSGFLVSADGYLVTNNHVITAEGKGTVESISVTLADGAEYPAKLIGHDAASDLAVLKIEAGHPLPFVKFGDSAHARVGDWIIAIGQPYGLGGTVTAGIISSINRNTGQGGAYDRYLQTDAPINRGNSGGPMFDMKGQVIGINNAIFSPNGGSIGIGFAIPAETAAPIVQRLIHGESIDRGYLGVRIQPLSDDMADSLGIPHHRGEFIQAVEPGKAAANAGIMPGDVVLKVNGVEVTPEASLSYLVANTPPGTHIPLELIRNGRHMTVNALVAKRPSEEQLAQNSFDQNQDDGDDNDDNDNPAGKGNGKPAMGHADVGVAWTALGVRVIGMTVDRAHQLGVSEGTHGVIVSAVDPSSDAAAKGLQRGDIVLSAGYRPVATVADFNAAVAAAKAAGRTAVLLEVQRRGQPAIYVGIRLK